MILAMDEHNETWRMALPTRLQCQLPPSVARRWWVGVIQQDPNGTFYASPAISNARTLA